MTTATLLVELLTEELPPKSLAKLAGAFRKTLTDDLQQEGFLAAGSASRAFATPRRLAVQITQTLAQSPDKALEIQGPSVKVGLDKDGKPTPALAGFAKKNGIAVEDLTQIDSSKGPVFACRKTVTGSALQTNLAAKVEAALKKLPVAKIMRWGDGDAEFVRPVHGLIMLHGASVVPGTVLGINSGNKTRGHRFMGQAELVIASAETYETVLAKEGMVIADFAKRRSMIDDLLQAGAKKQQATLGEYQDLLDEVTALVEHPSVYVGAFDAGFLEIPAECLILTMRQNQKYFPLFDSSGKLTNRFLIVSNMQVADPAHIISGNQRVVRPRLEDARFFYNQDRKERLETRVPQLEKVVYHNKLGTQLQRVERLQLLAGKIARLLNADAAQAERAAWLAKADLVTGMVGEFPELQGIMGRYYALHDGEPAAVAAAIAEHYRPRYAGDKLPESPVACAVALADKLETLAGMFGIGQLPTGDRDPFALRRHALGVIRILIERNLPLRLDELVSAAFAAFNPGITDAHADLETFLFERMRGYFADAGYSTQEIDAVLCMSPALIHKIPLQLAAVRAFAALPEAASLAAANKRIKNIIGKSAPSAGDVFSEKHFQAKEESELYKAFMSADTKADAAYESGQFTETLQALAVLKPAVDAFFDKVMVNVEDPALRSNRLLLLMKLESAFNRFADISKLAA
ncbi:MAG: glycine--tRNA ligase subunit beta [Burkholderiales bacterium]|nr:glycine--tRNA ligase subunit beta [Burkholderiales bacterium]